MTAHRPGKRRFPPSSPAPGLPAPAGESGCAGGWVGVWAAGGRPGGTRVPAALPTGGRSGSTFREPSYLPVLASPPTVLNTEAGGRVPCRDWGLPPSPVLGWRGRAWRGPEMLRVLQTLRLPRGVHAPKITPSPPPHTHTHDTHPLRLLSPQPTRAAHAPQTQKKARPPGAEPRSSGSRSARSGSSIPGGRGRARGRREGAIQRGCAGMLSGRPAATVRLPSPASAAPSAAAGHAPPGLPARAPAWRGAGRPALDSEVAARPAHGHPLEGGGGPRESGLGAE